MKTPMLQPTVEPNRVVVVSDAREVRPRLFFGAVALALAAAMALGGGIVYALQRGELRERDAVVQTARVDAANAGLETDAVVARIGALQSEVTSLQSTIDAQQAELDIRAGRIEDERARIERAQGRLDEVEDELAAVTGPKVSNGRHIAYLLAAGPTQSPPMMVIDIGRWFSGDAARRAAVADGALTTGEHLFHGRYLRNTGHDWRVVPVGTGALFSVRHYGGATVATNVSLTTLESIMSANTAEAERIAHNPFWVQVQGHTITSGHEQRYQAP